MPGVVWKEFSVSITYVSRSTQPKPRPVQADSLGVSRYEAWQSSSVSVLPFGESPLCFCLVGTYLPELTLCCFTAMWRLESCFMPIVLSCTVDGWT